MTIASFEISLTATKRVRRSTSQAKNSDPRGFYHLAAALAHPDDDLLAGSTLLESDYQDCLFSFQAQGKRVNSRPSKLHVIKALNKLLMAQQNIDQPSLSLGTIVPLSFVVDQPEHAVDRHGTSFAPQEIVALLAWASSTCLSSLTNPNLHTKIELSAINFHQELTTMAHRPKHRAFWFCGLYEGVHKDILVERASLFSANRLIKKSWQVNHGVLPGIRYYHAALHSALAEPLNVLYWLKLDEAHQIIAGEFINDALPHRLFCPIEDLRLCSHVLDGSSGKLSREIIDIYLTSLGEK